jgi:adenylate cyclase
MAKGSIRDSALQTDASPELVKTAKLIRRLLPGGGKAGDPLAADGGQLRQRLGDLVVAAGAEERPSAVRELGLGILQAWDTLSEAQRRRKGTAEVAILFTDLVGFSSWALEAGDDAALKLLKQVGAAEKAAISDHDGILIKQLGDGSMAVFDEASQAVPAALDAQRRLAEIDEIAGYRPLQRAGIHLGRPRKVAGDFLGIDVNIAARVADAARGGEVLVSDTARDALHTDGFRLGRKRPLSAPGAPEDLFVYPVRLPA